MAILIACMYMYIYIYTYTYVVRHCSKSQALDKDREKQKQFREPGRAGTTLLQCIPEPFQEGHGTCEESVSRSTLEKATQANARPCCKCPKSPGQTSLAFVRICELAGIFGTHLWAPRCPTHMSSCRLLEERDKLEKARVSVKSFHV